MSFGQIDKHSCINDTVRYEHLDWSMRVDFERNEIVGSAKYSLVLLQQDCRRQKLMFDTKHLQIQQVRIAAEGEQEEKIAAFELSSPAHEAFGSALEVLFDNQQQKQKLDVTIDYCTTRSSVALQWLPKEQTAFGKYPYLLTQCQAIHARSFLPCPDTPSVKFTYTAQVDVPSWATCLMSALAAEQTPNTSEKDGRHSFSFQQKIPIPSYLLAMVVGCLESRELGPRSRVWSEPVVVEQAAFEFAQTEEFLKHAEDITGIAYQWTRYDIVCMPPSFPFGGMENPCLTFVTPTLLAGDRSLADVVAHEIAHSWTGNLVTNKSWEDFWLNEGWTMWLERKIVQRIHQQEGSTQNYFDLHASIGWKDLIDEVDEFGEGHNFTRLVPNLDNVDPDDCFSSVPYEKGFNFLIYLTGVVGGDSVFQDFAKSYLHHFKYQTLTSDDFKGFFIQYFSDKNISIDSIDWETWFKKPGMPCVIPQFDTTLSDLSMKIADEWMSGDIARSKEDLTSWTTAQYLIMLNSLLLNQSQNKFSFNKSYFEEMNEAGGFSKSKNSEIRNCWYILCMRAGLKDICPSVAQFVSEQGRLKFVRVMYRELNRMEDMSEFAKSTFERLKNQYHPIAVKMITKDLYGGKD